MTALVIIIGCVCEREGGKGERERERERELTFSTVLSAGNSGAPLSQNPSLQGLNQPR